jgi:hypothetical protein
VIGFILNFDHTSPSLAAKAAFCSIIGQISKSSVYAANSAAVGLLNWQIGVYEVLKPSLVEVATQI